MTTDICFHLLTLLRIAKARHQPFTVQTEGFFCHSVTSLLAGPFLQRYNVTSAKGGSVGFGDSSYPKHLVPSKTHHDHSANCKI
ncbi:hypothetical protein EDD16DRAFT_666231 [Pisolithus croceorrhizus]|nr:hypothetical protein EDD16DRAFT_666231 [Pisolithus croceorrhizus]